MGAERVPCRTEGCNNTILPETAKANDGHCMPCVLKRQRQEREEYIRKNRREVNPYAGITDAVEIIRVMHTRRVRDPLIVFSPCPRSAEELYSKLNADQAGRLMTMAANEMRTGNEDFAKDVAKSLATLTDYPLDDMLDAWIGRNQFWPAVIFRGAGARIRNAVISALELRKANANHALSALAWIGDTTVQELFHRWEAKPPYWRSGLCVGPAHYANVAGWELDANKKRNLFHDECWAITPTRADEISDKSLRLMYEVEQSCPWCQRKLIHLAELNLTDERFAFLGASGEKLPILTCDACTCYGTGFMFSRIAPDGTARLADENKRPDWLPKDASTWGRSPWKDVPVRLHQRSAIHAVDWCMPVSISQIGGLPAWVQDSAFPKCPDCSGTMKFVAQVDNGQFPSHEGVYYAFLCASCRVTATTYQQT
ncbi:MAG TPA: hypothetical protein VK815_11180 [Candidatus Acidoferrales bacterium]|jgi:hypothetical protein|nr:hypothetical protein [Candidatus Acidoferrales bacterium]